MNKSLSKKIMIMLTAAIFALAAAGCGGSDKKAEPAQAADGTLKIAINATFPPFESVKEGTKDYQGVDIDIANYIGKKLGKTIEFNDMKFASLVPTMQSKRADMIISGISPTAERQIVGSFSKPLYFHMNASICKKCSNFNSLDKLKGKKAGASMGTTYVKELKNAGGIEVAELDSTPLIVQDIKNGRLAAGLFDSAQAGVFVKQNNDLELHILNLPVVNDDTFAIALPKDSKDVARVDEILQEMRDNGEMHKILSKHLGDEAAKQYEAIEAKLEITQKYFKTGITAK